MGAGKIYYINIYHLDYAFFILNYLFYLAEYSVIIIMRESVSLEKYI
jgi:hypothetical protein